MSRLRNTLLLAAVAIAASQIPFDGGGTDDKSLDTVKTLSPHYEPWFAGLWSPDERQEKALFAMQAGIGGALLGWCLMPRRKRS